MFKNPPIDTSKYEDKNHKNINKNMPKFPFRWLFVGSSGAGKTNCLINALEQLHYDKIHIICPTAFTQPKYRYLADKHKREDEQIQRELDKHNKKYRTNYEIEPKVMLHESMPEDFLSYLNPEQQNLVILDDMVCCSKKEEKEIINLFIRGRHQNAGIVCLTQSFYKLPRAVRLNANCFNIFHSVSPSELSMFHREFGLNTQKNHFVGTISHLIKEPYSFVHINIDEFQPFKKSDMKTPITFNKE